MQDHNSLLNPPPVHSARIPGHSLSNTTYSIPTSPESTND
jgi:hypothetical protein